MIKLKKILNETYDRTAMPNVKKWSIKFYENEVRYTYLKPRLVVIFDLKFLQSKKKIKYDMRYNGGDKIGWINPSATEIKTVLISIPFDKIKSVN